MEGFRLSWKGDWFLRRKRLYFIDKEITETIPNILLFEEMLHKQGNPYDSDKAILETNSLAYYDSFPSKYKLHTDTEEVEQGATYVRLESSIAEEVLLKKEKIWKLKDGAYLIYQKLVFDEKPLSVFNVNMPKGKINPKEWLTFLKEKMSEILDQEKHCYNNVIFGGFFGEFSETKELEKLMKIFNLVDTAKNFCSKGDHLCDTEHPSNPILNSSKLENKFRRSQRIYVHRTSLTKSAGVVYNETYESLSDFKLKYKLYSLGPSLYYGWQAKVQLSSCLTRK